MINLPNLQHEAKKLTLSPQEKAFMRAQIFGEPAATPRYVVSHWSFFSIKFAPVMATFLIVALGGGTAYAAEGALPGELLYTVKVNVNEPVRGALAISTEAKAAFHTSVAETRLEEAEELAAEGRLTALTSAEIEERLETHLVRAEEVTKELKDENSEEAEDFSAELDSTLSAHSAILAKLGEESDDDETREHSRSLAGRLTSRVFARLEATAGTGLALKTAAPVAEMSLMAMDATSTSDTALMATEEDAGSEAEKHAAEVLKARAEKQFELAQETFEDIKQGLEATTTARVEAQFKMLEGQMSEGVEFYEAGDYAAARALFGATARDATELWTYLKAEQRFNKKYLRSWVDNRFGGWFEHEWEDDDDGEVRGERTGDDEEEDDNEDRSNDKDDKKDNDSHNRVEVEVDLGL